MTQGQTARKVAHRGVPASLSRCNLLPSLFVPGWGIGILDAHPCPCYRHARAAAIQDRPAPWAGVFRCRYMTVPSGAADRRASDVSRVTFSPWEAPGLAKDIMGLDVIAVQIAGVG